VQLLARLWEGTHKTRCNTFETHKRRSRVSMLWERRLLSWDLSGFPQPFQINSGIMPQNKPRSLFYNSLFTKHHQFDTVSIAKHSKSTPLYSNIVRKLHEIMSSMTL
jgi:hypothetical protein